MPRNSNRLRARSAARCVPLRLDRRPPDLRGWVRHASPRHSNPFQALGRLTPHSSALAQQELPTFVAGPRPACLVQVSRARTPKMAECLGGRMAGGVSHRIR